jgi:tetratricopeptide (TPR) repeat protein
MFPAVVLGASGLALIAERARDSAALRTAGPLYALLLVCGAAMSWADWWGVRSENVRQFECARLSNAYWRNGNPEKALEYAERCERESPGYPSVPLLRGQALYSLGRYEEAGQEFRKSERALPEDPVAPHNLGILCYYSLNRPEEAAACFEESLRRQPQYPPARWMAVRACVRLGRMDRARELLAPRLTPPGLRVSDQRSPMDDENFTISYIALCLREGNASAARETTKELQARFGDAGLEHLKDELKILGLDAAKP